jgi:hypothetical protein
MVVLALMSVVSLMFYQMYMGTIKSTMFIESKNDLAMFSQRTINRMKMELMQSRRLYQNDTRGNSYLNAYQIPGDRPVLNGSRLPIAHPNGVIEEDATGETYTGNMLLTVRERAPHEAVVDHDGDSATADVEFLADLYSFQLFYLAKRSDRELAPHSFYVDLHRLDSQRYADYFQLQGLDATYRTEVASSLHAAGIQMAWDPNSDADSAFYSIESDGSMTAVSNHAINPVDSASLLPELHGGRISGSMVYSVGIESDPSLGTPDPVSVLAQKSGLFPSGLEVKVIGPTGARKIFARLMLVSQYQQETTSRANTVVVTIAEF